MSDVKIYYKGEEFTPKLVLGGDLKDIELEFDGFSQCFNNDYMEVVLRGVGKYIYGKITVTVKRKDIDIEWID